MKLNDTYIFATDDYYRLCVYMGPGIVPNHCKMRYLQPDWIIVSCRKNTLYGPVTCATMEDARRLHPEAFI